MIHLEFANLMRGFWIRGILDLLMERPVRYLFLENPYPVLTFFKLNFDGSTVGNNRGVGFVIKDPDSRLIRVGSSQLFGPSVLETKL